ncbi:MAG: LysM peptidoglycan-binding domain-containing protein [Anaerolineae bacterium]|nr:LysM peptidoglycan-binding domain-containing protein [Anaerolineae bacterium]
MTRQQAVALVICNAVVSLVISLTVVLVFERYRTVPTPEGVALAQAAAATEPLAFDGTPITGPTAEPLPQITYVVKSGDSLGSVAFQFGVTLDALMQANGIENANYIVAGQSLVIPVSGPAPAATATHRPPPTMAPVATPGSGEALVAIESVSGAGRVDEEYVRLVNRGAQGVALEGWVLEDEDGHAYTFPNLFLWRNGTVSVHSTFGNDSATDLYWGLTEAVWSNPEERVRLLNASGELVAEVKVGTADAG